MADYLALQSGTGVFQLQDGSGNILLQSDTGGAGGTLSVNIAGRGGLAGSGGLAGRGGGLVAISQDDGEKKAKEA